MLQPGQEKAGGCLEAGDPNFFIRRGYVQVVANSRGTGKSGGTYDPLSPHESRTGYVRIVEAIMAAAKAKS